MTAAGTAGGNKSESLGAWLHEHVIHPFFSMVHDWYVLIRFVVIDIVTLQGDIFENEWHSITAEQHPEEEEILHTVDLAFPTFRELTSGRHFIGDYLRVWIKDNLKDPTDYSPNIFF